MDGYYNYDRDGNVLPLGAPVRPALRDRRVRVLRAGQLEGRADSLTVTAGLRYSLFSPPWEVNGLQVAPDIKLGDWFEQRRR